jgi:hypothetical protein
MILPVVGTDDDHENVFNVFIAFLIADQCAAVIKLEDATFAPKSV